MLYGLDLLAVLTVAVMAHPVTTHCWVVRRWVKSGDQIHLVEVVLCFRGYLDVILLDLGKLGTVLVVVAVRVAALDANRFHFRNRIMEAGTGNVFGTWLEPSLQPHGGSERAMRHPT
jgi:hypothetical protein